MHVDYLTIGSAPAEEDCAQVGTPDYYERAVAEGQRFITQLRAQFGPEPAGARLRLKAFPHDFGTYHEVVCLFEIENEAAVDYAYRCEAEAWPKWKTAEELAALTRA